MLRLLRRNFLLPVALLLLLPSLAFGASTDTCYDTDTVLMLQMEDASLSDTSASARAITLNGNVARSSAQAKFGTYSAVFDGSGDWLSAASSSDFALGTADWTLDGWVYWSTFSNTSLTIIGSSDTNFATPVSTAGGGRLDFNIGGNASNSVSYTINTGQWIHVAITKASGTCRIYMGGVSVDSWTCGSVSQGALVIGAYYDGSIQNLNGYADSWRLVKGTAVWSGASSFTPPSAAYTPCAAPVSTRMALTGVGQ